MELTVGAIMEGTVTGLTTFGAFVTLQTGQTGLVHISEVANHYVNTVQEHLTEGQTVRVKVLALGENGKINLSIKKAAEPAMQSAAAPRSRPAAYAANATERNRDQAKGREPVLSAAAAPSGPPSFEDKLKAFMKESETRRADIKNANERKTANRRPRGKG